MKAFDIDAELAKYQARKAAVERLMFDYATERMLIAALLADDAIENRPPFAEHTVSAIAVVMPGRGDENELEVDDFGDYRHRTALTALRNLQAAGSPMGPADVLAEVGKYDARRDVTAIDKVPLVTYLFDLIVLEARVTVTWIECALVRLRALAQHRRLA